MVNMKNTITATGKPTPKPGALGCSKRSFRMSVSIMGKDRMTADSLKRGGGKRIAAASLQGHYPVIT